MSKSTLVCPAGSLNAVKVAVNNGADCVYLGVEGFNARSKAGLNREEFIEAVRYAHLFGVKIYVAINILIYDSEMIDALNLAEFVYLNGADAIIVQDLGLYYLLKNRLSIDIHLSTQLGIHNIYGAEVVENKLKASHIVLSRETILEDIKKIKSATNLNLEFFVHGALCVGFSGNCYYSSMLAQGSGNRGTCYQFCRKPYTFLEDGSPLQKGFMLSTSDICMLDELSILKEAGISHFKIEGRNRREGYIGGVVRIYSQALKGIYTNEYKDILKLLFYRGEYNKLYLNGQSDLVDPRFNNHVGVKIGEITKIVRGKFNEVYFTSNFSVENNDTLKIFENGKEICTTTINDLTHIRNSQYMMTTTNQKLKVGQELNLISNYYMEQDLINAKKYLPISMDFTALENEKPILKLYHKNIEIIVEGEEILSKAVNQPLTEETCLKQFSKLGETYFKVKNFTSNIANVFISIAELNKLRRKGVALLEEKILEENSPKIEKINDFMPKITKNKKNMILVEIKDNVPKTKVDKIILPLMEFNSELKNLVKTVNESGYKAFINLPIVARGKDLEIIDEFINHYSSEQIGIVANNIYGLHYLDLGYEVIAGEYMNTFNTYSVKYLKELGVSEVILSPEINQEQINEITDGVVKLYGDMYYMCYSHCPKRTVFKDCSKCEGNYTLLDEKKSEFKIKRLKLHYCYNYLVSNQTTNIIGEVSPNKKFIKQDLYNLDCVMNNLKYDGIGDKKFTYGLLYKKI